MWVYQRMFDLHYTANLLEGDPGSKPEQAERQVKTFRQELEELQAEIDAMSKEYPQIAEYIKTVPYPGERPADQRNPDGTLKKREPVPDEKRVRPVDQIPNPERVQNQGDGGGPRKRIDPEAPFLNSIYDAGVWWNTSEPDLTFFDVTPGKPRDLPLYRGGNLGTPTDLAPRGFPLVLAKDAGNFNNGSGRLELGEKIFTDAAPLSARVMVNRVWGWHFDKHLVGTPSDFGIQGCEADASRITGGSCLRDSSRAAGRSSGCTRRSCCRPPIGSRASRARARWTSIPRTSLLWRMNPRRMDIEVVSRLAAAGVGKAGSDDVRTVPNRCRRRRSPHGVCVDQPRPQQRRDEALRRAGAARRIFRCGSRRSTLCRPCSS